MSESYMGVREELNRRPYLSTVVLLLILAAGGWFAYQGTRPESPDARQFYTDDDGKTWFADKGGKIVPYERSGKTVVLANVFEINGRKFVAYMTRYPADVAERLRTGSTEAALPEKPKNLQDAMTAVRKKGIRFEYKKPGDSQWHDIDGDPEAMARYLNLNSREGDMREVAP
jgi:hypothetical protein